MQFKMKQRHLHNSIISKIQKYIFKTFQKKEYLHDNILKFSSFGHETRIHNMISFNLSEYYYFFGFII